MVFVEVLGLALVGVGLGLLGLASVLLALKIHHELPPPPDE
jgi:hypothetical protein